MLLRAGAFSILPCKRDGADMFTTDDRLKVLTFTGSPAVRLPAARMPPMLPLCQGSLSSTGVSGLLSV